jgi:hypothetical protein
MIGQPKPVYDRPEGGAGAAPEDSMLEQRVARLEDDMRELKGVLKDIQRDLVDVRMKVSAIDARLATVPTSLQLLVMMLTTWSAGAAIVFALPRFAR